PRLLGLYNRGYYGTSHGWAGVHSVAWNCDVANGDLIVQKPPTAQNYAIGCFGGNVVGKKPPAPFDETEGYIEGTGESGLNPRSLYEAQLEERLATSVRVDEEVAIFNRLPQVFTLNQNHPNPFNSHTTISFDILKIAKVEIIIFDIEGRKVTELLSTQIHPGRYSILWDAGNKPSGMYFIRMKSESVIDTKRILLLK
ncbi:MAG: T9SS type A sorting domain-containing protein, partial [bacterium]